MRSGCSSFFSRLSANCFRFSLLTVLLGCVTALLIASPAHAQTYSVIHAFTSAPDGAEPFAGLSMDRAGNLYGTTSIGGYIGTAICSYGCGTVFKLSHTDAGWTNTILYAFKQPPSDGVIPAARVIFGPDGALYGTTYEGGAYFTGTVFRLAPPSHPCTGTSCPWTETIYNFPADYTSGYGSDAEVAFDRNGNLFGTTYLGGAGSCDQIPEGCGVVFEIAAPVLQWQQSVVYDFTQQTGFNPNSGVLINDDGTIYGAAAGGGTVDRGVVYKLSSSGGSWTQSVLYSFTGQSDGSRPDGGLIQDAQGNLYGTTALDGSGGGGTVFELSPSGGGWTFNLLYSFTGTLGPIAALSMDADGNLYGTTERDGAYGFGNVFKLTKSNGSWTYTSLYDFTGGTDGANPETNVLVDSAGNLYGTATYMGPPSRLCPDGCGVVWEITP